MAEPANEIDLLALQYMRKDAREAFAQRLKSGWDFETLAAALSSYHARWLKAREATRG